MAKGTAGTKMMPNMSTYGGQEKPGYHPPSGSAGKAAIGEYSHKTNPMSVPRKGSQLSDAYGNADTMKAQRNKNEQARNESLRGQAC